MYEFIKNWLKNNNNDDNNIPYLYIFTIVFSYIYSLFKH